MVVLYLSVIFSDSKLQALRQFGGAAVSLGVSCFIVFVCVMVEVKSPAKLPPGKKFNVYIACMCVEMAWNTWQNWSLAFGSFLKKVNCPCHKVLAGKEVYPLQIDTYQERIGSFVMIIFGEVLVKNLCRYYDVSYAEQTYGYSIASLVIVFMFGILYYEAAKEDEDRHHALRHSIISSYLYIWMHLLVACSAFFTNAAIGVLFEDDYPTIVREEVEEEHPSDDAALILSKSHKAIFSPNGLLACSMGLTLLFLAIISLLHKGLGQLMDWQNGGGARRTILLKLFLAFIHFIVPATGLTKGHELVATHAVLLSLAVAAELRFKKKEEEDEKEEEGIDGTGKRKKGKNGKKKKGERDDYHNGDGDGDEESKSVHSYDDDERESHGEDDAIPRGEGDFHRRMRMRDDFDYDDRRKPKDNQMDHDHGGDDDSSGGRGWDKHHVDHDHDNDHHDEYEDDYEGGGRGQQLVPLGQEHMYVFCSMSLLPFLVICDDLFVSLLSIYKCLLAFSDPT
jgi:hypothetical protein